MELNETETSQGAPHGTLHYIRGFWEALSSPAWWRRQTIGDFPLPWDPVDSYWDAFVGWAGSWQQIRTDILCGLSVGVLLVADSLAFALLAKAPVLTGLYASFFLVLLTSCLGGRPGMISGATGALAAIQVLLMEVKFIRSLLIVFRRSTMTLNIFLPLCSRAGSFR